MALNSELDLKPEKVLKGGTPWRDIKIVRDGKENHLSPTQNYERPKHPPKYCPECGSNNINHIELMTNFRGNVIYDTYCKDCEWSGDVVPDTDLDYYRVEAQENWETWGKS